MATKYCGLAMRIKYLGCCFGENAILDVYDMAGRLVYEQIAELNEDKKIIISSDKINSLIEGTYFIHFHSNRVKMMAKFVKLQN